MFDMTTSASVEALALAASILASGAALFVIALHMVRTDVDPLTDGVSAYAITPFGYLYRIQVVATGVATLTLTLALLAGGLASGIGVVSLALFAASRILIARYPTDPRGTTHFSRSGRAHVLLAAITFVTMAVAAPSISGALTTTRSGRARRIFSRALGGQRRSLPSERSPQERRRPPDVPSAWWSVGRMSRCWRGSC